MRTFHRLFVWVYTKLAIQIGLNSSNLTKRSLRKVLKSSTKITVIDVGANIGEFSKMCRDIDDNARIIAIEPQPLCHDEIRLNSGRETIIIGKVVSSKTGFTAFKIAKDKDRKAHVSDSKVNVEFGDSCRYEMTTIDELILEYNFHEINLLKIDTEGYDFEVLKGARDGLASGKILVVIFEIMPRLVAMGSTPVEIEFYLRNLGFKYFYRSTPHLGLLKLEKLAEYELHTQNIVASKHEIE